VLLSSHQLPEVQELCDRVAIVESGRVVYEGALSDLRRQGGTGYTLRSTDDAQALAIASQQPHVQEARAAEEGITFQTDERHVAELTLALGHAGIGILSLTPVLATLEDLFFRLTEDDATQPSGEPATRAEARGPSEPPLVRTS
jgi:ABC-2 type transport system ATP-binding protein